MLPKIIQIMLVGTTVLGLGDDGSVWQLYKASSKWERITYPLSEDNVMKS